MDVDPQNLQGLKSLNSLFKSLIFWGFKVHFTLLLQELSVPVLYYLTILSSHPNIDLITDRRPFAKKMFMSIH